MTEENKADGRRLRKENNKKKTIETILDMILETGEEPSIEAIVERSGVSRRSVFYYFNNREMLICEINNLIHRRIGSRYSYPEADSLRPFSDTLRLYLDTRIEILEYIAPLRVITEEKKRQNEALMESSKVTMDLEADLIDRLFKPYFEDSEDWPQLRLLLLNGFSWNSWSFYRHECGLTIEKSRALTERQISKIVI